jgi:hypothetical protein
VKKLQKKVLTIAFSLFLIAILFSLPAQAKLIYDLNEIVDGPSITPAVTSFGTVTFEDSSSDSDWVDITVDLTADGVHRVQSIYFNFSGNSTSYDFDTEGSDLGVVEDEGNLKAGGYPGFFDLKIPEPPPGNLGFEIYSDTISATKDGSPFSLTEQMFNALDTSGNFFVIVHIGNYGGEPGVGGEDSIWVGSQVPIPGSVLLLSSGLLGVIFLRRKKSVK